MSQQISLNNSTGKSRQTVQSYQPVWMAHWMRTSGNTSTERRNHSARPDEELDRASKDIESVKEPSLRMSSKSLGNEGACGSLMKHGQGIDDTDGLRPMMFGKNLERGKAIACKDAIQATNGRSLRQFRTIGEGTSNKPLEWMKNHSSTHIVPYYGLEKYELDKGKTDGHPESDIAINACFKDFNTSLLFGRDWFQKMQGIRFLPTQSIATEEDESNNKSQFDFYSLKKLPNNSNVRDLETMRICTTVDSVEAAPGGCPRFSQTTHSLLITKKTENDVYRATRSPFFGQGNGGVKLQPLSSSSNSEGRNNVRNVEGRKVTIKNESSAETDTMEMDFFKDEKLNSGANSTPSTKAFNIDSKSPPSIAVAPSHGWTNSRIPDINLELPTLPAVESSPENLCPSPSRTQSLEMDTLLANADKTKSKPNLWLDDSDPSNLWVKRLKLSSSNSSSQGTKISNPAGNLSHEKMRKYFRSVLDSSVTSSEPSPRNNKHHNGKEKILSDKNGDLSKEDEVFTVDTVKKVNKESLLSHVWIKRWLRNGSRVIEPKPDQTVEKVSEPRDSKLSIDDDDLERKQFPSIAAMAMMGKALNGFHSCEVQKRGSCTVWNTKEAF